MIRLLEGNPEVNEAAAQAANDSAEKFILIMYVALLFFVAYRVFQGVMERRKLENIQDTFEKPASTFGMIVAGLMLLMSVISLFTKQWVPGIILFALAGLFFYSSFDKVIIAENGIYGDGQFIPWRIIRKWGFDTKSHDLIFKTKDRYKEKNMFIRVMDTDMVEINDWIRKYKLNK